MKEKWEKIADSFNARILRERLLIALCVFALIYVAWELLFYSSMSKQVKALNQRNDRAQMQMQTLTTEEIGLSRAMMNNPNALRQKEILSLEKKLGALDVDISKLSAGLVDAKQLPTIIRTMISEREALSLLGLSALPPEKLSFKQAITIDDDAQDDAVDNEQVAQDVGVFKHAVVFRLAGNYFDLLAYLKDLENSHWQFYWSSLDYQVQSWPRAVIQLEAYTLATEAGFISE